MTFVLVFNMNTQSFLRYCFFRMHITNFNYAVFVIFSCSSSSHIWNQTVIRLQTSYFFILNIVVKNRYYMMFWVLSVTCLCPYHSTVALDTVNKKSSLFVIGCFHSLNDVRGSSLSALISNFYSRLIHFGLEFHPIMFVVHSYFPAGYLFLDFHPQNFSSTSWWLTLPCILLHTGPFLI